MKIQYENEENNDLEVLELQGDIENIEHMDATYENNKLYFNKFYIEGVEDNTDYYIVEKIKNDGKIIHKIIGSVNKRIVFNKPPKYKMKK